MIKTSVCLSDEDKRRLSELAFTSGVSESELLRRGVRRVLDEGARPQPHVGIWASGDGRAARDADRHLQELGFGE